MAQTVFEALAESGTIHSAGATWDNAQDGGALTVEAIHLKVGQEDPTSTSDMWVWQGFLKFDTSPIPDGATVSAATLEVYVVDVDTNVSFIVEAHARPWGSLDTSDFMPAWLINASTRAAYTNITSPGEPEAVYEAFNSETLASVIEKATTTQLVLVSTRQKFGDDATAREWVTFAKGGSSNPPRLTVVYNTPPDAPLLTPRTNFDATQAAVFGFTHSDQDGDPQAQYQYRIYRVSDGALVFDSGAVVSASATATLPGGTLANGQQYQWQARTWDPGGFAGAWAQLQSFYTSAPPAPTITNPATNGTVVTESTKTITWSLGDPESEAQSKYRLVRRVTATGAVEADTGEVSSSSTQAEQTRLLNGVDYTLELTTWDAKGIANSAPATRTFSVAYSQPPKPLLTVVDDGLERLKLTITNPTPTGAEVVTASNDLYRRKVGGEWARIATALEVNVIYLDFAVASGQDYEYKVVALTGAGGSRESDPSGAFGVTLNQTWLHDPSDPVATSWGFRNRTLKRTISKSLAPALMHFEGRAAPVAEFGDAVTQSVDFDVLMLSDTNDLATFRSLVDRRATLCYRDSRGRKVFGVIAALTESDHPLGAQVPISITATHYPEEV